MTSVDLFRGGWTIITVGIVIIIAGNWFRVLSDGVLGPRLLLAGFIVILAGIVVVGFAPDSETIRWASDQE